MLPDEAADVLSVRSGFAPEAGRIRRIANRQLAAVEDFATVHVRQRHFGGRDEIQVPLAGDLEKVGFKLRQLSCSHQRCGIDEDRRLYFGVRMLARVQIQHERDERAFESSSSACQD